MSGAAVKASKCLLRDFSELENLQVSIKSNQNFVTSADLRADGIIKAELLHARPAYSFLSEESEEIIGEDSSCRWIADPLDGTVNYMHGFPHWAVSLALEKDREIVAAVTYDPVKNEMFWAEKGGGAYLNDRKIRVSGRRSMSEALISSEMPQTFAKKSGLKIRRTGAITLDMAYLAAGRTDVLYLAPNSNLWDIAAGMLLVKEAGGVAADEKGNPTAIYEEIAIMANINLLPLAARD
jgi:myo-inositol-1(or 4)-monophosphatase